MLSQTFNHVLNNFSNYTFVGGHKKSASTNMQKNTSSGCCISSAIEGFRRTKQMLMLYWLEKVVENHRIRLKDQKMQERQKCKYPIRLINFHKYPIRPVPSGHFRKIGISKYKQKSMKYPVQFNIKCLGRRVRALGNQAYNFTNTLIHRAAAMLRSSCPLNKRMIWDWWAV